ncbi:MAG: sugar phosphate nucleotidyltransferase, partial [Kiritimatiellae bacterium]|nr:sugar phosphate nucleotidyltransferase [Kiritimatiellia bacterium]
MSNLPAKALVLAAGLGERLRPLTLQSPKPLLPLWGVPLLGRILDMLEAWGVREVAINLHWRPEMIRQYLAGRESDLLVRFSHEPEILGTGGALRPLRSFLEDGPFWVVNSDIVAAALDSAPLLSALKAGNGLAAAWLEPKKGPRTVEADRKGRVTCFRSPTPGVPGTFTFCGAQVVSPRVFDFLPENKVCSIIEAYERAMEQGVFVDGVT